MSNNAFIALLVVWTIICVAMVPVVYLINKKIADEGTTAGPPAETPTAAEAATT